jgi:hypothetical protein
MAGADMAAPRAARRDLLPRLLAAGTLGIIALLLTSPISTGPWWWQPAAVVVVFVIAVVASQLSIPDGRGALISGLVIVGLGAAFIALRQMARGLGMPPGTGPEAAPWNLAAGALGAVLVGLSCALVAQRQPSVGRALGAAALGWLVALAVSVLVAILNPNVEGVLTGIVILVFVSIPSAVLVLLGGLLGWGLRAATAGGRSSSGEQR